MRLNKTHKQTLLNFALERTTVDPDEIAKHQAMTEKYLNTVAEYFAKQMGTDYSSLKRQKCLKELTTLRFRVLQPEKDKYGNDVFKDYNISTPKKGQVIKLEVPRIAQNSYHSDAMYELPKSVQKVAIKYYRSANKFKDLKNHHRRDFKKVIDACTTFKRVCEVFPDFENAAHLIMDNTQLVVTTGQLQKVISQYAKVPS